MESITTVVLIGWLMQVLVFGLGAWMLKALVQLQANQAKQGAENAQTRLELNRLSDYPALEQRVTANERRINNLEKE